jgi:hypothetical protein
LRYKLAENIPSFKKEYPQDPFIPLINIYEMGFIPLGVYNGKYAIFQPPIK